MSEFFLLVLVLTINNRPSSPSQQKSDRLLQIRKAIAGSLRFESILLVDFSDAVEPFWEMAITSHLGRFKHR